MRSGAAGAHRTTAPEPYGTARLGAQPNPPSQADEDDALKEDRTSPIPSRPDGTV